MGDILKENTRMFSYRVPCGLYDEVGRLVKGAIYRYKLGLLENSVVQSDLVFKSLEDDKKDISESEGIVDVFSTVVGDFKYLNTLPFGTSKFEVMGIKDLARVGVDGVYYTKRQVRGVFEIIEHASLSDLKDYVRNFIIE